MPAVNDVGEPCAGEPHARFDGRGLETEARNLTTVAGVAQPTGKPAEHRPQALPQEKPPRQPPTLHMCVAVLGLPSACRSACFAGVITGTCMCRSPRA
jgi:hypothetical protein